MACRTEVQAQSDLPASAGLMWPVRRCVRGLLALTPLVFAACATTTAPEPDVAAELDDASDLLFLFCEGEAVGFAWTRLGQGGIGEIEPFGIAPPFQRCGCGRLLLQAALHRLARQGATRVHLGVWRRNQAALALYRSAGFAHTATRYYLARDLV